MTEDGRGLQRHTEDDADGEEEGLRLARRELKGAEAQAKCAGLFFSLRAPHLTKIHLLAACLGAVRAMPALAGDGMHITHILHYNIQEKKEKKKPTISLLVSTITSKHAGAVRNNPR